MNDLLAILKGAVPALATAVMGPMGSLAVKAIADKLGVPASISEVTTTLQADPELVLKLKEIDTKAFEIETVAVTERWKADMSSDSWLSKNIRPMTLIAIFIAYFLFAALSAGGINVNESYVKLLGEWGQLIMLAYFGGRTAEKIMDKRK
jgi:hypothetical protein